jgi:uncharacterized membrane protein HdeD (DUF308 family)
MVTMLERASQRWWTLVVRGVLVILFGILILAVPVSSAVTALIFLFGIFALLDGFLSLGMLSRPAHGRWLWGVIGVLSIAAGIIDLVWPGFTAVALFFLIAWWAILTGIAEVVMAVAYSDRIENEWAVVLSGLLSIGFGLVLVIWPGPGMLAVLALIATYAILRGVMLIVAGVRMRKLLHATTSEPRATTFP